MNHPWTSVACGVFLLLSLGGAPRSAAQPPPPSQDELTVPFIMQGPELVGTSPSRLRWSTDGSTLYFVWKEPGAEGEGLYRVDRDGGRPERVDDEEARRIEARLRADVSEDRRWAVFTDGGDLYLLDVRDGEERLLVSVPGRLSSVRIAPDGSAAYFVLQDNLFRVDVASGSVTQLTDIRRGRPPRDEEDADPREEFLEDDQRELLRVFRVDSIRRNERWPPPTDPERPDTPQAFYVRQGQRMGGYWPAPDGGRMAFTLFDEADDVRLAWVPDYVTEDGYTKQAPRKRPLVGDERGSSRLGVMDLVTGAVTWADHGQGDREVRLMFRGWSNDSDWLLAVGISDDVKDRWVLAVDPTTGESRTLDRLHDDAWIGGPGWANAGWMPDGEHVYYISEATGFAHLHTVALGGGEPRPLTTGPWEVLRAWLSHDDKKWYLVTSERSPHERGFYHMDLDGSDRELITATGILQGRGGSVAVAPDGRRLAWLRGWSNHPPELFLQENKAGARVERLTQSVTPEFAVRTWIEPEIVYFPARDGLDVPARLYRPASPNGAAVIFVHGAGYLQNVHRWWSSYYREYMFHNLLVQRGYTVLDIDYRGSAGYGRDWRTAIHQHMGSVDLNDQVDGARFLVDSLGIAPDRIGIYGGSYGGFITLMALFKEPGTFVAGAALRPVT
ncbi:MAG: prolyl oligopeptidase family serine peptidase, partial [Gemmatimonadetes bacterium]|nr:prolyl oligopeptidase family serine peptidase [Gemmatimonadota bacterium]NIR74105.1 prolyl oligopeptidase family serine peptidase [Candidatus Kutchimonas denitrificans]NIS01287.1 prolyl oligopeptidase family serine peptidase [Gemmatimonadota bacterium]NIT67018.1 prolyl oligopeptidase family serine peptidase [Gemmatimonadota bacterium]NIU51678.1 prolyl oligopeptidase family serine peptidase [Gemmatimonadota bacterium]